MAAQQFFVDAHADDANNNGDSCSGGGEIDVVLMERMLPEYLPQSLLAPPENVGGVCNGDPLVEEKWLQLVMNAFRKATDLIDLIIRFSKFYWFPVLSNVVFDGEYPTSVYYRL